MSSRSKDFKLPQHTLILVQLVFRIPSTTKAIELSARSILALARVSADNTVTDAGTSISRSFCRRAVTMISPPVYASVSSGASRENAGTDVIAMAAIEVVNITRVVRMILSLIYGPDIWYEPSQLAVLRFRCIATYLLYTIMRI
jgi:hypothetical protein